MRGLIRASLMNPWAVTVFALTIVVLGSLGLFAIPVDILPVYKSPAVQTLTFYSGMPPRDVERDITNQIERFTDMAAGLERQESRSILGTSVVLNYFSPDTDPGQALASVQSLATSELAYMPPGTLPPVVMPFDPTGTTPICLVALDGAAAGYGEKTLYDVGRYEVRDKIMEIHGAFSPVVFGGKIRTVQVYLDHEKMLARNLSSIDVMRAVEDSNVFLPTGEAIVGDRDYFLNSNALFEKIPDMGEIPLRTEHGNRAFLRDVATPTDDAMIQTTIVRVGGQKQAFVPVFRQAGASTLSVISQLKTRLQGIREQLTKPGIDLKVIMDQSVYVTQSIRSLATEGILGAVLCSLVILLFLGRWQMTMIAILTIPLSILSAVGILYAFGQTINVMTLSGLSMAIGPMVDSAIISLENIDSHLEKGAKLRRAALDGPAEVALPELVANLSTLMVLAPLALMPGSGSFLFRPMTMAVAFAMLTAYILSRTFVPARAAAWLRQKDSHEESGPSRNPVARAFARWQTMIEAAVAWYSRRLDWVLDHRWLVVLGSFGALAVVILVLAEPLRREFFPLVDSGAFEIYVRAPSGTRLDVTNDRLAEVEQFIRREIPESDLKLIVTQIGVTPDFSAAYTVNQAKMDAIVRVQLTEKRHAGAYEATERLRSAFNNEPRFADLEFAFNAGGLILSALNQGKTAPINVRVTGLALEQSHKIAELIRRQVANIPGVVDARILQRLDYPEYIIEVDRAKAADLGLTQDEVMKNVIGSFNSSIQYNKKNFWIDRQNGNNYFVGVQYPLDSIKSLEVLLDVPITGVNQTRNDRRTAETGEPPHVSRPLTPGTTLGKSPVMLSSLITLRRGSIPTEITHMNILPTIDLNIGVSGRDLGHVAGDVSKVVSRFGKLKQDESGHQQAETTWDAFDPSSGDGRLLEGTEIVLSGEFSRMEQMFYDLAIGLTLAVVLIYFLMVALDKSYIVPLANMTVVPLVLIGIMPMLYLTGTSINIQSLLGLIFTVGIKVSATVLLTDVAQDLRKNEGLSPIEAIRRAGVMRARPIVMTALAAFFAMIPAALALEKGSEANAPLGRAILGGLLIGTPATLLVAPALYALMVRGPYTEPGDPESLPEEQNEEEDEQDER
jgi:multidrug efflux pump subunit AcrB